MIKIKILKQCFMPVIMPNGDKARKDCFPGEIVDVEATPKELEPDIKAGTYRIYNNVIIRERPAPVKLILPDGLNLDKTLNDLKSAISGAVTVLNAIQGISSASDNLTSEQPKEENTGIQMVESSEQELTSEQDIETDVYNESALRNRDKIINSILANETEVDGEGRITHSIITRTKAKSRLPLFAQANTGKVQYKGSIELDKQNIKGGEDILDKTPIHLENTVLRNGESKTDMFKSLGAKKVEVGASVSPETVAD